MEQDFSGVVRQDRPSSLSHRTSQSGKPIEFHMKSMSYSKSKTAPYQIRHQSTDYLLRAIARYSRAHPNQVNLDPSQYKHHLVVCICISGQHRIFFQVSIHKPRVHTRVRIRR